jgi:hypothetical protein
MSVLTLGTDNSNTTSKTIRDIFDEVFGCNQPSEQDIPGIASLPRDRRNKVVMIRRQIARGTYDTEERLLTVIDRILTDVKR